VITARRIAPFVLRALLEAHRAQRPCTLDDLCALYPVRRADLRRTLSALHRSDLFDLVSGRLTLRGFAVAIALAPHARGSIRDALKLQPAEASFAWETSDAARRAG
jgi:hypothetical protein